VHGIILSELHKFVVAQHDSDTWRHASQRAGLLDVTFTPLEIYPDDCLVRLLAAVEAVTSGSPSTLLESFGEHLILRMLVLYEVLLKPSWRTLDVIEHAEETVHRVVRLRDPGASPPRLRTERTTPDEVVLTYDSPRRLCALARGIARGIGRHFGEELRMEDRACMHRGDAACIIVFGILH
jgi:hypothetical protein